jgi:hypothetical protein
MNKYYIISLVLFITSIVILYTLLRRIKESKFGDIKTQKQCGEQEVGLFITGNASVGDQCALWFDPDCYKGFIREVDGKKLCDKDRDFLSFIFAILFVGGVVGSIIFLIVGIVKRNDIVKKNDIINSKI